MSKPPSEHPEYGDVISVARAMNNKLNNKADLISGEDYVGWLEPTHNNDGSKFDAAVCKIIPQKVIAQAECLARLDPLVLYVLGLGPQHVGGCDMQLVLEYDPELESEGEYGDSGEFTNDMETIYQLLNSNKFMGWIQSSDQNFGVPDGEDSFEYQLETVRDAFNKMHESLHKCGE